MLMSWSSGLGILCVSGKFTVDCDLFSDTVLRDKWGCFIAVEDLGITGWSSANFMVSLQRERGDQTTSSILHDSPAVASSCSFPQNKKVLSLSLPVRDPTLNVSTTQSNLAQPIS